MSNDILLASRLVNRCGHILLLYRLVRRYIEDPATLFPSSYPAVLKIKTFRVIETTLGVHIPASVGNDCSSLSLGTPTAMMLHYVVYLATCTKCFSDCLTTLHMDTTLVARV